VEEPLFNIGDIVIDSINKEVGVLLRRYNLLHMPPYSEMDEVGNSDSAIIVWDIYWCGPTLWPPEHLQSYTEEGLEILLDAEVLTLYKNI
jgi:hypothetical protein